MPKNDPLTLSRRLALTALPFFAALALVLFVDSRLVFRSALFPLGLLEFAPERQIAVAAAACLAYLLYLLLVVGLFTLRSKWFIGTYLAFCIILIFNLHGCFVFEGDIPKAMDPDDIAYEKTLDIKPTFGTIWYASSEGRDPTYYYRLQLSQADFERTEIHGLKKISKEDEPYLRRRIWWNPASDAQCFVGPGMSHRSTDYYFYDSKRQLLFAECEM